MCYVLMITSITLHAKNLELFTNDIIINIPDIPTEPGSYVQRPTGTKSIQQTQTQIVKTTEEEGPVTYQEATGSIETHEGDKTRYWYQYTDNPTNSDN